jgi:hypothetical protein
VEIYQHFTPDDKLREMMPVDAQFRQEYINSVVRNGGNSVMVIHAPTFTEIFFADNSRVVFQ